MNTLELKTLSKELMKAASAADDLEMEHPKCKSGHGLMYFDDGECEQAPSGEWGYTVPPAFYCPKCGELKVIS